MTFKRFKNKLDTKLNKLFKYLHSTIINSELLITPNEDDAIIITLKFGSNYSVVTVSEQCIVHMKYSKLKRIIRDHLIRYIVRVAE